MAKKHDCRKQKCVCDSADELARLYKDLKQLRKRVADKSEAEAKSEFRLGAADAEIGPGEEVLLAQVRELSASVREIGCTVREVNDRLDRELSCLAEESREVEELHKQISISEKELQETNLPATSTNSDVDEKKIQLELREKNRLQAKMKMLNECLEIREKDELLEDNRWQNERRDDVKYIINIVDYLEKTLNNAETFYCDKCLQRQKHKYK